MSQLSNNKPTSLNVRHFMHLFWENNSMEEQTMAQWEFVYLTGIEKENLFLCEDYYILLKENDSPLNIVFQ